MVAVAHKPHLDPTAARLRAAIAGSDTDRAALAQALGVSAGTLSNMVNAKSPVRPKAARILGKHLGVDPETITSPSRPSKTGPGPAAKAADLFATRAAVQVLPPRTARNEPDGVFGMNMLSDGTMNLWLRTNLPLERGSALLRILLDFGVAPNAPGDAGQ